MRIARPAVFCAFMLGLAAPGWAMGRRPKPPAATEITPAPASLTLLDCYRLALRRSESLEIRQQEIVKSRAQWFLATGEAIGDIDFVSTDLWQDTTSGGSSGGSSVGSTFTARERRERKFTLSQPLFQGFKSLGAIAGAGSLTAQRRSEKARAKELLFLDVARAFYAYQRQQHDVETIEGILQLFRERVDELSQREKIGRSRAGEVATARARMKSLEAELARSKGVLAAAGHELEFYTGVPVNGTELEEEETPAPEPPVPARAAAARSDVEAYRQAARTAKQAIVVAQSALWPKVTLDGNHYEKREGFQSGIDWDALFTVRVPLGKGGDTLGKIGEAVADWRKARWAYRLAKRQAELEIKQAYEIWAASAEESHALEDSRAASEENFRLQREDYAHNLVNNLDVLQALESLFSARRDANRARYQMKENYWALRTASGQVPGLGG